MSENKKTSKKVIRDSRAKNLKTFSLLSIVVLIALVILINVVFDLILGKYLTFDFSATGQNSISQISEDYINNLPADTHIRIVGLFDEPTSLANSPYEYTVPLLNDYATRSGGRVTVEYINPVSHPSIITELDPQNLHDLTENIYVVQYGNRIKTIAPMECFNFDEQAYQLYGSIIPISNNVESRFTNAIASLVRGYVAKACFVVDTNDSTFSHDSFSSMLEGLGIESVDLPMSDSFSVPADCDILFINGLNVDIPEYIAVRINDYISHGGKIFVALEYGQLNANQSFTNLNSVLATMNLRIDASVIKENDTRYLYSAENPFESRLSITQNYQMYNTNAAFLHGTICRPIVEAGNPASYITTAPVLQTSNNATLSIVDMSNGTMSEYANPGVHNVGMHSEFSDALGQEAYVFGTTNFTSDTYIGQYSTSDANIVFVRNIISDMLDISDSLIVESKPIANYDLNLDKVTNDKVTLVSLIFMAFIPLVMVIAGVVVYNKRKNL